MERNIQIQVSYKINIIFISIIQKKKEISKKEIDIFRIDTLFNLDKMGRMIYVQNSFNILINLYKDNAKTVFNKNINHILVRKVF